jgi:hypothetical protein
MSTSSHALRRAFVAGAVALALPFAGSALAAKPDQPYSGSCSTVIAPQGPPPAPGAPQLLSITYDCTLAHLGRTSAVAQQVVSFAGAGPSGVLLSLANTTTYSAANGDQLIATFQGSALLDPQSGEVTFVGIETFHGGSGRFASATGNSQLEGTASVVTNRGFFNTKGRIAY